MALTLIPNASLRSLNTFGVDASALWLATAENADDLAALAQHRDASGLPWRVIGAGSNVLITGNLEAVVVQVRSGGIEDLGRVGNAHVFRIGAGVGWHRSVTRLEEMGAPGLENLALIPGLVGAAPIQNIGAYGVELAERLHSVHYWDTLDQREHAIGLAECQFGYRDSVFKRDLAGRAVILSVLLALPRPWTPVTGYADVAAELQLARGGDDQRKLSSADVFNAVVSIRRRKLPDPALLGNAGSFFKNPIVSRERRGELIERHPSLVSYALAGGRYKLAAGWLIEACGLKGATRGRAGVYERQALVLVNRGGATGAEILALAREVQEKVLNRFGVVLETEPLIL